MTVNELIEQLQEIAEDGYGETDVRLAFQPNWPLQFEVGRVTAPDEAGEGHPDEESAEEPVPVVYIAEGGHPHSGSPYAPGWAFGR